MPTQGPLHASGQPLHTRTLAIDVTQAGASALGVRAEILDLRKVGFVPTGGDLQTAGFIHHMQLQLRVDRDSGTILELEAFQPHVPFEANETTGGESCRDVVPRLEPLVGRSIERAFHRELSGCFGGPLGCSHLLTLAQAVGAMMPDVLERERDLTARGSEREADERVAKRAIFLDGFAAGDGEMGVHIQLSDFETTPRAEVVSGFDRLARQREAQATAGVDLEDMHINSLEAVERSRTPSTLAGAPWRERTDELASFIGRPALAGMASACFEWAEGRPDRQLLRDALLQFAPGLIQCFATRTEELLLRVASSGGQQQPGQLPRALSVGGTPNSCHMWRADGVMSRQRSAFEES